MIPIDFQVTCTKVEVKPLFRAQCLWSSNDSEILAFLPFDHDNVVFYSYLIMFSSALYEVPYRLHVSSNFEFCTKGGIYVSETLLV